MPLIYAEWIGFGIKQNFEKSSLIILVTPTGELLAVVIIRWNGVGNGPVKSFVKM